MLYEPTLNLFPIWIPKVSPIYLHNFSLVERPKGRTYDILVYNLFFFCGCFLEVWWGSTLYIEMTDFFYEVLDVSLVICLLLWFVSCPPGWKEFVLEFRTPANNIVSLFPKNIFLSLGCETNLCS